MRGEKLESGSGVWYANRFAGRVAIITGGASGSGKAVGKRIVAEGGRVALWDLNPQTLAEAQRESGAELIIALDVSDPDAVAAAARQSFEALGKIDLLVCSAGITGATAPVTKFPIDNWQRVMDINLNGVFYCCREIIPYMVDGGYGRVVNMSSVAGKEGNPNASAYSAAKAGVIALTKSLGKELATSGVLVNAIAPAVFRSPLNEQVPQSHIDFMISKIPMNRLGEIDEITAMTCWLLSEECSFSTGATFDISGGRLTY